MTEEEFPILTLDEARERVRTLLNAGEHRKAVGVMLYYERGKPDAEDKFADAVEGFIARELKKYRSSNQR